MENLGQEGRDQGQPGQLSEILSQDKMDELGEKGACVTCTDTQVWSPALYKPGQETKTGGLPIPQESGIPSRTVLKQNKHQAKKQECVQMASQRRMLHGLDQVSKGWSILLYS